MWRSLQFRLYASLTTVVILLCLQIGAGLSTAAYINNAHRNLEAINQQRIATYRLTSLAHRLLHPPLSSLELATTRSAIEAELARVEQIQDALSLREGSLLTGNDEGLNLSALETAWNRYRGLVEESFNGDERRHAVLILEIEAQSEVLIALYDEVSVPLSTMRLRYSQMSRMWLTGLSVLVVLGVMVAGYFVSGTVRALARLRDTANEFAGGNLNARATTKTVNEIATVGQVLNNMAERLGTTISELQQSVYIANLARTEAERANRAKTAFLAGVSHELRTPLHAIINLTHFVADGDVGAITPQQDELLRDVIGSANHLLVLINDVLDMSKIESGSLVLMVEENVNVREIVEKVVTLGEGLLAGSPVTVHTTIDPALPAIRADRQRLLQVLLNIMSNACKFTPNGLIEINAKAVPGEEIVIAIRDSGIGISPDDQPLVFAPFKQTDEGLKRGGTGLGMPISKSLVEAHGGTLCFESESGSGSTFFVTLPVQSTDLARFLIL